MRIGMGLWALALVATVCAKQVAEDGKPPATGNDVRQVPAGRVSVSMPAQQETRAVKDPGAPGKVTEVRDEHVEVIDGKIELVTRTIRQTESRLIGPSSQKAVPPPPEKAPGEVVAAATVVVEVPSLEPPPADAADAKRLVRYFCRCWKDGDYVRMWWAMSPRYRLKAKYEEFHAVFVEDAKTNGGLSDENIGPRVQHDDWGSMLDVELRFKLRRVQPRKVKAACELTKDGYRMSESGIIPVDMNNL